MSDHSGWGGDFSPFAQQYGYILARRVNMPVRGPGYQTLENLWLLENCFVIVIFLKFTILSVYTLVVGDLMFVLFCFFVFLSPFS